MIMDIDKTMGDIEGENKYMEGIMNKTLEAGVTAHTGRGIMNKGIVIMRDIDKKIENIEGGNRIMTEALMTITQIDLVLKEEEGIIGKDFGEDRGIGREGKGEM